MTIQCCSLTFNMLGSEFDIGCFAAIQVCCTVSPFGRLKIKTGSRADSALIWARKTRVTNLRVMWINKCATFLLLPGVLLPMHLLLPYDYTVKQSY